jgi:branched-chain amino acid transport system substrate-binding protein
LKQARALRIAVPFLGGDGWDSDQLLTVGGADLNGCYFSNHYSADSDAPVVQDFVAAYKNKYQETPNSMAALSYDGLKLLADAIVRANSTDPAKIRDALAQTRDFQGVTGRVSIDAERNASKSAVILQIKDGKIQYYATVEPDSL